MDDPAPPSNGGAAPLPLIQYRYDDPGKGGVEMFSFVKHSIRSPSEFRMRS